MKTKQAKIKRNIRIEMHVHIHMQNVLESFCCLLRRKGESIPCVHACVYACVRVCVCVCWHSTSITAGAHPILWLCDILW